MKMTAEAAERQSEQSAANPNTMNGLIKEVYGDSVSVYQSIQKPQNACIIDQGGFIACGPIVGYERPADPSQKTETAEAVTPKPTKPDLGSPETGPIPLPWIPGDGTIKPIKPEPGKPEREPIELPWIPGDKTPTKPGGDSWDAIPLPNPMLPGGKTPTKPGGDSWDAIPLPDPMLPGGKTPTKPGGDSWDAIPLPDPTLPGDKKPIKN